MSSGAKAIPPAGCAQNSLFPDRAQSNPCFGLNQPSHIECHKMPNPLIIRADASVSMGTGHIMRMIALAQAWQDQGGKAIFLTAEITPALEARLKEEGFSLEKIHATPGSAEDLDATCAQITSHSSQSNASIPVALDGYQFDADFQLGLKNAGCRLLVMDDYGHADFYHADWILNQNISAKEGFYQNRSSDSKLLLGTKYALLRREFLKYQGWKREIPEIAKNVLVTLGGADPENITQCVVEALSNFDIEARIVVESSNPHLLKLRQRVSELSLKPAHFELIENAKNMPELMAWADLAIAAWGSTTWELAFMGLPSLFVILEENQVSLARQLEKVGFGICLGKNEELEIQELIMQITNLKNQYLVRKEFSRKGRELVEGNGASLVTLELCQYPLKYRIATLDDIYLLWDWVNDPEVRSSAFNSSPIPFDEHVKWYKSKLEDKNCNILIICNYLNEPIGQVRFEFYGKDAIVDFSVSKKYRGKGYSKEVLKIGINSLSEKGKGYCVKAYVKKDNIKSQKVFKALGFLSGGEVTINGFQSLSYFLNMDKNHK